ncbi:MAG: hypothetical protein V3V56_05260 [bacterium]
MAEHNGGVSVSPAQVSAAVNSSGQPLPRGPSGTDTSRAFPVAAKVIASASNGKNTVPPKPALLTQSLQQQSLRMNFLREGGRGARVSVIV